jgi:hypothetical protein
MLRVDVLHNRQPAITVNGTSLFFKILRIIKTVKGVLTLYVLCRKYLRKLSNLIITTILLVSLLCLFYGGSYSEKL